MRALTGGGTDGNEQLTSMAAVVLLALLVLIGVTIVRIGQLLSLHLFVGLLLLGPVAVKLASTGYRFVRYYGGDRAYRTKGPPPLAMRLIAPVVVLTTVIVFATGIVLLGTGPRGRDPWLLVHKVSFIVWVAFTAPHVLWHLFELPRSARAGADLAGAPGAAGRWLTVAGSVVGGVVLALVLIPQFGAWTAHGAILHHHHH